MESTDQSKEKSKLSSRGRASRAKGARWERELAKMFAEAFPGIDCKRWGYAQGAGGKNAPDVECGGLFWVEAKIGKKPNPRAALDQAVENSVGTDCIPVACVKDLHGQSMAVLRLDDFLAMVKQWYERSEANK